MPLPDRPVTITTIDSEWGQAVHDYTFAPKGCDVYSTTVNNPDMTPDDSYLDLVYDDPGGGFLDAANNQVEVPTGGEGLYFVDVRVNAVNGGANTQTRAYIYLNGSPWRSGLEDNNGGTNVVVGVGGIINLTAGDTLQLPGPAERLGYRPDDQGPQPPARPHRRGIRRMSIDPHEAALWALIAICLVLVGAIVTPGRSASMSAARSSPPSPPSCSPSAGASEGETEMARSYPWGKVPSNEGPVISERFETPMVCCGYCSSQFAAKRPRAGVSNDGRVEAHQIRNAGGVPMTRAPPPPSSAWASSVRERDRHRHHQGDGDRRASSRASRSPSASSTRSCRATSRCRPTTSGTASCSTATGCRAHPVVGFFDPLWAAGQSGHLGQVDRHRPGAVGQRAQHDHGQEVTT